MNPKRPEEEYYNRIINEYREDVQMEEDFKKFETFACRELISILEEWKDPNISRFEREQMADIAKNSLLLVLSFFTRKQCESFRNFEELDDNDKNQVKTKMLALCS